jgi:hypothetical protein
LNADGTARPSGEVLGGLATKSAVGVESQNGGVVSRTINRERATPATYTAASRSLP